MYKMKMKTPLCMLIMILPFIMFHPINMVKLLLQETIMMEDQMMHKVIHIKMVLSMVMSKLDLNSTIKKEMKTILHKTMVLILQSIKTMMMKMMVPSKDQLKCHIQEFIIPFNRIIPLITYWGAFNEG